MPSLLNYGPNDVFTVRTYKYHVNNPSRMWANSYEMRQDPNFLPGEGPSLLERVQDAAAILSAWERTFHWDVIRFDRYVLSTWLPDGQPHAPDTFDSTSYGSLNTGLRNSTNVPMLPLEACLLVRKGVQFGRDGRNLYRGVLSEGDVSAPAGAPVLDGAAAVAIQNLMDPANLLVDLAGAGWQLVMKGSSANDVVRPIVSFSAAGVVFKKLNNRYYDQTSR